MSLSNTVITPVYGYLKLVQVACFYDGNLHLGGYSIQYGRDGKAEGRNPVSWNCSLIGPGLYIPPGYEDLTLSVALGTTPPPYPVRSKEDGDKDDLVPSWHLLKRFKAFCDLLGKAKERQDGRDRNQN